MLPTLITLLGFLTTAAFAAPFSPSQPVPHGIISIPLSKAPEHLARRSNGTANLDWLKDANDRVRHKYGGFVSGPGGKKERRAVASEALTMQSDGSLWRGPIIIGGQSFTIDFDTGSSDLWVPGSTCTSSGCSGHSKYSPSSTGKQQSGNFKIQYGDGSTTSGPIYTDDVSIAGLKATAQRFSPVTQAGNSFSSQYFSADGIAGLGFPALSWIGGNPLFHTLIAQKQVTAPVFSFRLASSNSELYLGGINSARYSGAIAYASVTDKAYWTVPLGGVKSSGKPVSIAGTSAVIDTGTTFVYGSYSDVKALWSTVPNAQDASTVLGSSYNGYWLFPCNAPPSFAFTFGGTSFTISAANINLGKASSTQCVGAIVGQDPNSSGLGNTWLVGDAFLKNTYTIFDVGNTRVGFASPR